MVWQEIFHLPKAPLDHNEMKYRDSVCVESFVLLWGSAGWIFRSEPASRSQIEKYRKNHCELPGNMENFWCPFSNAYRILTERDTSTLIAAKISHCLHVPRTEYFNRSSNAFRYPFGEHCHFPYFPNRDRKCSELCNPENLKTIRSFWRKRNRHMKFHADFMELWRVGKFIALPCIIYLILGFNLVHD